MTLRPLILIRHAEVAERYGGVCYGQSDVELSERGRLQSRQLAERLATRAVRRIVHSGLSRTAYLADLLAGRCDVPAVECQDLRERHFGDWELQSWDELYRRHGDDLLRLVSEPDSFRPAGGETTYELRDRMLRWYAGLPADELTVAVTHGGPIAALLGCQRGLPVAEWIPLIPACGECVELALPAESPLALSME